MDQLRLSPEKSKERVKKERKTRVVSTERPGHNIGGEKK
jgi:hypothetical protein